MKTGVKDILGKRVTGAMLKHCRVGDHSPSSMLILMFDDELTYEFFSQAGQIKPWLIELDASILKAGEQNQPSNAREFLCHWGEAQFNNELLAWLDDDGKCQVELSSR
jgi:hypothetical protein